MRRPSIRPLGTLIALTFCFASFSATAAARGQIVLIDEEGQPVYINTLNPQQHPPKAIQEKSARPPEGSGNASPVSIEQAVERTSRKYQVDPRLVNAIIQVESQYNVHAVSPKGAMGLMQLVPATAERFGVHHPFDPSENIRGGVSYLRYLLNLFNDDLPLTLAAYNAGENAVLRNDRIPRIPETQNYVRQVTSIYGKTSEAARPAPEASLPPAPPITSFVDAHGVTHFTNDGGT